MKLSRMKIASFVLTSLLSVGLFLPCAEAGVLFRNNRNAIRIAQPRYQNQQYRVRKSTSAMRATSGNIFRAKTYGGVPDTMKLVRANIKYEEKLFKWEQKKLKNQERAEQKRKQAKLKESKRREKEFARLKKKKDKDNKSFLASLTSSDTKGTITNKPAARGALTNKVNNNQNEPAVKKTFWASLWEALTGKKS
jgi:hypothetical protein